jgi:hypothetical protein
MQSDRSEQFSKQPFSILSSCESGSNVSVWATSLVKGQTGMVLFAKHDFPINDTERGMQIDFTEHSLKQLSSMIRS